MTFLSREEERRLLAAWQQNGCEKSRNKVVLAFMPMVEKMTYKICRRPSMFEDLVQEGVLALMRAADKFDLNQSFRFGTYAKYWVYQRLGEYVMRNWQDVRGGMDATSKRKFYRGERVEVIQLDAPLAGRKDDSFATVADVVLVDDPDWDSMIDAGIHHDALRAVIESADLAPREREVLVRRTLSDDTTLQQVADSWGVSKERVRQIEAKAIGIVGADLRKRLGIRKPKVSA